MEVMDGVHEVLRITEPYKLASRTFKPEPTLVSMGELRIIAPAIGRSICVDPVPRRGWGT